MYYNIKIKTDDSELSLDSSDKIITQREMDLYFAVIFKASDDFKANIKEIALKKGYKESNLRSYADFSTLAESSDLKKYEAKSAEKSSFSNLKTTVDELNFKNEIDDDLKAYEIKNVSLAANEIVSIKNLKEKQDIFAKINRKELFSETEQPKKEQVHFEKINTDVDLELLNSKIALTSHNSDTPTITIGSVPTEAQEAPSILELKNNNEIPLATTVPSPVPTFEKAAEIVQIENAQPEMKIENTSTIDSMLNEAFGASKETPLETKTPEPTLAEFKIQNEYSRELSKELSREELNRLRNEYRNEMLKEEQANSNNLLALDVPKNQGNLIDDEDFELGNFEIKEQSQTQTKEELPEIETIINETKAAVQKEETLNTLFGPEISPTVIDEITLDELATRFNETKEEPELNIKEEAEEKIEQDDSVAPTPLATKEIPLALPVIDDTMVSAVAAVPVVAQTSENPHPSIEEINKVLEPPQIPMNEAKPTIAEIEAKLTIQDDLAPDKNKEYDILDSSKKKAETDNQSRPFGVNLSFADYLDNFDCRNIYDEFLACAYYLKHYLKQESFSIKTINAKLYQAKSKIANMSVVTTLVDNEYLEVLPQENSNLYSISKLGERYFKDKLKF